MLKALVPLIILLAAIGLTVLTDKPAPRADFTFINRGDVSTLDLQKMSWMQDLRVGRALFEGLVALDIFSRDYAVKPGVAERWEVSSDGLTYTFHLRSDAKWSNGAPVTAGDFVYSWRRILLPDTGCDYAGMAQIIRGAKEFSQWREARLKNFGSPGDPRDADTLWTETLKRFDDTVQLKALDDRTFTFTLSRPTPYFLDLCAFATFFPVYPPQVRQYERLDPATGRMNTLAGFTKGGVLISNGPYMLTSWRFKRDMRFVKNPYYWNRKNIAFDSMLMVSVEDPNAQVLAFTSGSVDWLSDCAAAYRAEILEAKHDFYREHQAEVDALTAQGLDPTEIDRLLPADARNRVGAFSAFGTYFYSFNCLPTLPDGRANPFADKRVRRAFAMAVDKRRITDQVRRLGERPVSTLVPPGSIPGYTSPNGLAYDPVAARELLAEAGFPAGRGLPTIEILFTKDGGHDTIAQSVKKDWEQNLGVSVELVQREIKVFRNDVRKQNFMVSRGSWYGDFGDPCTFLDLSRRDDGNNDRKYASPKFEELMDRADNEADAAARLKILEQAERLLVEEDLPILPFFQYVEMQLYDPHKLTGISSHPRQIENLQDMDVLGDGKGSDAPRALPPLKRRDLPRRRGERGGRREREGREGGAKKTKTIVKERHGFSPSTLSLLSVAPILTSRPSFFLRLLRVECLPPRSPHLRGATFSGGRP